MVHTRRSASPIPAPVVHLRPVGRPGDDDGAAVGSRGRVPSAEQLGVCDANMLPFAMAACPQGHAVFTHAPDETIAGDVQRAGGGLLGPVLSVDRLDVNRTEQRGRAAAPYLATGLMLSSWADATTASKADAWDRDNRQA